MYVTKGQGIIIEPGNQRQLEEAIVKMLDTHTEYNSENLSKYAQSKFSLEVVGRDFMGIYTKIIRG